MGRRIEEQNFYSLLLSPNLPRQLRRLDGLPIESTFSGSGAFSSELAFFRNAGGLGALRVLVLPLLATLFVLPTFRLLGVRRIVEADLLLGSAATSSCCSLLDTNFRVVVFLVRLAEARRVFVPTVDFVVEDLRVDERLVEVVLVAALSSPLGEAASSETSGRVEDAARARA